MNPDGTINLNDPADTNETKACKKLSTKTFLLTCLFIIIVLSFQKI